MPSKHFPDGTVVPGTTWSPQRDLFDPREIADWLRTKPTDEEYRYSAARDCLLFQYLEARGLEPISVTPWNWCNSGGSFPIPAEIDEATRPGMSEARWPEHISTFGAALQRFEALS